MVKIKNFELVPIWNLLNEFYQKSENKSLTALLKINIDALSEKVKSMDSLIKSFEPSKEFIDYEESRIALAKKYASTDEKGEFLIENNKFVFSENKRKLWQKAFDKLKNKNEEIIVARDVEVNTFDRILSEEIEVDLYKIPFALFPENIHYSKIDLIVLETEEELVKIITNSVN